MTQFNYFWYKKNWFHEIDKFSLRQIRKFIKENGKLERQEPKKKNGIVQNCKINILKKEKINFTKTTFSIKENERKNMAYKRNSQIWKKVTKKRKLVLYKEASKMIW